MITAINDFIDKQTKKDKNFCFADWFLPIIQKNKSLWISTHPCKFSHPSAETTPIIAEPKTNQQGYLFGTGVQSQIDVFGNGALITLSRFLALVLADGKTVFEHIKAGTTDIRTFFSQQNLDFDKIQQAILAIPKNTEEVQTSDLVKQVYFPVGNGEYHLLSLLTPSGLINQLKQHIDNMSFSDDSKNAKECRKKNEYHESGFADIYNLTVTAYGGTKPQNISALNQNHAGRAYLLPSMPPTFTKRNVRLPSKNFFTQSLYIKQFEPVIQELNRFLQSDINNYKIRQAIENIVIYWIDMILREVYNIRKTAPNWTQQPYYEMLPTTHKILLDDIYHEQRDDDWQTNIAKEIARYMLATYHHLTDNKLVLGDAEFRWFTDLVAQQVQQSLQHGGR